MMRPDQALSSVSAWVVRLRLHILGSAALGLLGGAYHARQAAAAKDGRCGCYGSPVFVGEYSADVEYDLEQASTGAMSTGFLVQSDVGLTARLLYEGALKLTPMDTDDSGGSANGDSRSLSGERYAGKAQDGSVLCLNSWATTGTRITGGCSTCDFTFAVQHTAVDEGCSSLGDLSWNVSWPYEYYGYNTLTVEYNGNWYPFGWIISYDSSGVSWYDGTVDDPLYNGYFYLSYYDIF